MKTPMMGGAPDARTLIERQIRNWDRFSAVLRRGPEKPPREAPSRPVIAVSGTTGSDRGYFCMALAKELGYELWGREALDEVARDLNCQRSLLDTLDERVRSDILVILESYLRGREIENQEYIGSLIRVMQSLAAKGGAVILGRGAAFILAEKAALRVKFAAPLELRVRRVMEQMNRPEKQAREFILEKDREQEEFVQRYFRADVRDPQNFDLAINTERIPAVAAVSVALEAIRVRGLKIEHAPAG